MAQASSQGCGPAIAALASCLTSVACTNSPPSGQQGTEMRSIETAKTIAAIFEAETPIATIGEWTRVATDEGTTKFERRIRLAGNGATDVTVVAEIGRRGGAGQAALYQEVWDARHEGRMRAILPTSFGLTILDGGDHAFRQYLLGPQNETLLCTFEGLGAPAPFVRCSWSHGEDAFSIETSPIAIHHALAERGEIEHLALLRE